MGKYRALKTRGIPLKEELMSRRISAGDSKSFIFLLKTCAGGGGDGRGAEGGGAATSAADEVEEEDVPLPIHVVWN